MDQDHPNQTGKVREQVNTLLILSALVAAGPCMAAVHQAEPVPAAAGVSDDQQWNLVAVGNTTIELPVPEAIETAEYRRTAPDNYKIPSVHWTKRVPAWCPAQPTWRHGYSCNMQRTVEDLAGHLQSAHGVSLETLNEMGRDKWQSFHEDQHWCDETPERQEMFLHPAPAKPAAKSACGPSGCPSGNCPRPSYQPRLGLFPRWR